MAWHGIWYGIVLYDMVHQLLTCAFRRLSGLLVVVLVCFGLFFCLFLPVLGVGAPILARVRQTPVQQRHVQLLGRSVDLTHRISGAMNRKITEVSLQKWTCKR